MKTPVCQNKNMKALGLTAGLIAFSFALVLGLVASQSFFIGSANAQPNALGLRTDHLDDLSSSEQAAKLIAFNKSDSDDDIEKRQKELEMVITPFKQDGFSGTVFEFTPQSNPNMRCIVFSFGNVSMSCVPKLK